MQRLGALGGFAFLGLMMLLAPATAAVWHYTLLPESTLLDDCPVCDRPSFLQPLRGGYDLRLKGENPLFAHYTLENLEFTAGTAGGRNYKVTGHGTYSVGGEVALVQDLTLELSIDDGFTNRICYLTNATPRVDRLPPMFHATALQTNGSLTQAYQLDLYAAPFREIWFSTVSGMTSARGRAPSNQVSGGDLLSSTGRIVRRNHELTGRLGIMPIVPDLGLDGAAILPGGEVIFSTENAIFSETLGALSAGDLLSQTGKIYQRNQELIAAFDPKPPPADVGLDALQAVEPGELYFSIRQEFFSNTLGRRVRAGDLLSRRGLLLKTNEELVARFQPADPKRDYGLDALHVWPSGEVWFSVETGFQGPNFEHYGPGDLLSDQGYVVYRNLELVGAFQPLEDLADFGLDALFIVTDVGAAAAAPRFAKILRPGDTGGVELQWDGKGRVWEVLRATNVSGPWLPLGPLQTDLRYLDLTAPSSQSFYQLRQF